MAKQTMHLIGLVPNLNGITPEMNEIISGCDVLAGDDRFLNLFPNHPGQKMLLRQPLSSWLSDLKNLHDQGKKVVILTSGDPSYFGIAPKILALMPPDEVAIIPSTTLVQQAFARLKVSWDKAEVVNLHGRSGLTNFWSALYRASHYSGSGYLAVYTDSENTPTDIAKRLLGRGQPNWKMHFFEDLATKDETHSCWTLFEAKLRKFSPLNLVVLECFKNPSPIFLGMPEEVYVHEAGLITKLEVRAVALGLLELQPYHTFWDLGAGSGSISIEAAALLPHGSIWAVEKSPLRSEQIAANRAYFGAAQVEIVEDEALAAMTHLPPPDRVFIGVGGNDLVPLIKGAMKHLTPQGLIVVNVITLEALRQATTTLAGLGLTVSVTQIQAARSEPSAGGVYLKPLNQIWLVRGQAS